MQIKCKTSAAVLSTRLLFHFSPYQIIDKAVYCLALRLGKSSDAVFVPLVNSYLDLIIGFRIVFSLRSRRSFSAHLTTTCHFSCDIV